MMMRSAVRSRAGPVRWRSSPPRAARRRRRSRGRRRRRRRPPADRAAAAAGAARAGRRADDRAARAGARRRDRVGVARRPEPQLAAQAGVLRARQQRARPPTAQEALDDERRAAEADTRPGPSPSKDTATSAAPPSTIWRWASGARSRRAPIWSRSASPPIGCGRSATARNSRSIRATTKRRSRRTAARISSSPRSETL